jgi:hypothetical protein
VYDEATSAELSFYLFWNELDLHVFLIQDPNGTDGGWGGAEKGGDAFDAGEFSGVMRRDAGRTMSEMCQGRSDPFTSGSFLFGCHWSDFRPEQRSTSKGSGFHA